MVDTKNNRKITGNSRILAGDSQVNLRSGDVAPCMYGAVIAVVELRWPFMFVASNLKLAHHVYDINPEKGKKGVIEPRLCRWKSIRAASCCGSGAVI
jgi:hypothetical protein